MKKQFTNKIKALTAIGVLSTMSLTAIATPIIQEVSAKLRKDITFTINGEKTLDGASTLQYNDTTYIPVRALSEALGLQVEYKNGNIAISKEANTASRNVTEEVQAPEKVMIEKATIKTVNKEDDNITVTIVTEDQREIVLNISEDTLLNGEAFKFDALSEGTVVSVTHSPAMTRSLPPQTAAFEITTLEGTALPESITLKDVKIVEISEDLKSITVGPLEDAENPTNQTILILSEETTIKHHMNRRLYKAEDLEVGQKLTVVHSPVMTLSLPGQTTAFEITLMD